MSSTLPRKTYARIPVNIKLPNLIEVQLDSFERLKKEGLGDLFHEVSPIESYNKGMKLFFPGRGPEAKQWGLKYWFGDPKHTIEECVERDLTYASPLYVSVLLAGADVPEPIKQDIFLGDFPEMTDKGTFIINGTERVVVSQLIRSPGVYFEAPTDRATGRLLAMSKLIPDRGAWMEFETRKSDYIILKFNRKRTVPITVFLRALAAVDDGIKDSPLKLGTDEELLSLFQDVDNNPERLFLPSTLKQEPEWDLSGGLTIAEAALIEFFKKMRPGDPATLDNARQFLEEQLFDQRHYDLERVGRYKLNQKLDLNVPIPHRTVTKNDVIRLIRRMIQINNGVEPADDIDHLGNRRVKTVGELIQNKLRIGLRRMERVIKERMSIRDQEQLSPVTLVNIRPVVAALREFFGSSQLSQFMDQTNPLAELRHKRTLSALGPGGLRRERAGFDVRDVHHSHYGRICPIETPEGPNIGLIGRLASFARVNEYGFIETPYRKVFRVMEADDERLEGRTLREKIVDPKSEEVLFEAGETIDSKMMKKISKLAQPVEIVPYVSDQFDYLSADAEDKYVIAQANAPLTEKKEYVRERVSCRYHSGFIFSVPESVDYMDVAPHQVVGISAALIPFLEHDDANRALMGSNMQAQAVPLVRPEVPLVSTGMEYHAALDSGQVVVAEADGEVTSVTGNTITVRERGGSNHTYQLRKYQRSNQSTCIDQRPAVVKGQKIKKGDIIADSSSTESGQLALGQNVVIAFLSWEGGNFEDAILISERLVQEDRFTSVHIEKYEVEARDTKLGPEEITRDIPNVGEDAIKDLDENGIIRIGAEVGPNDILVGKITPKGEKELTPEERLLRAIFGEKSRDVKDTSLRMPHGERGKVVDVKVFTREENSDLSAGVDMMVRVSVAQRRKLTAGDKMAGRHGNKGVVSKVVPVEDMPFLEDGTPVDLILNPLGVPGRMNIGQVLEVHLGWAAKRLGYRAVTPVFDGASEEEIEAELARAWIIDEAWKEVGVKAWEWIKEQEYDPESIQDDDEVRRLYLEEWLSKRKYDAYDLNDVDYARLATATEWLRDRDYDPDTIFYPDEINPKDRTEYNDAAVNACLRLWIEAQGHAGRVAEARLMDVAQEIVNSTGQPLPILGKQTLRDGKTGIPYDQPVTVGVMTVLKLHHLVEDKVHARSTGPYSLVTQQPLGGKAQFGGQRFGEMEVWALEAYGAAYTLQEMLTVKSDDVQGRVNTYEAIVKGEPIEEPSIPASFRVLVKELQSLGLAVEAVSEGGDVVKFGKDEEKQHPPRMDTGLLGIGDNLTAKRKS
ncbi:MAG: DNA-directed RNA polymerase subunit beta [Anaerolineales bacterium]|nr:DNA-directed RNA polymerase subunit beta [Anaerolineae bacterium]MBL8106539.1 DNA-directed RNA polymerase subunit beta [Anaerolineales bacterium]MBV6399757.1 DNA-directed RNA polymerase subunit beta [Anaerolineales bacterium]MCC7190550.1 DNA-directed RNA polymerase subunit beta [Anaerolineales bacterium]